MQIIAHRGFWLKKGEMNTMKTFRRAFNSRFGVETDVRDRCGSLVISHDPAGGGAPLLSEFLKYYREEAPGVQLALNIKADGLQQQLKEILENYGVERYFVFDMSFPDMLGYRDRGLHFYTRQSEYEVSPLLYREADGVWLDCFEGDWITETIIREHLHLQKKVCLVSPELHHRDHLPLWKRLRGMRGLISDDHLALCTDYPEKARLFFYEPN